MSCVAWQDVTFEWVILLSSHVKWYAIQVVDM